MHFPPKIKQTPNKEHTGKTLVDKYIDRVGKQRCGSNPHFLYYPRDDSVVKKIYGHVQAAEYILYMEYDKKPAGPTASSTRWWMKKVDARKKSSADAAPTSQPRVEVAEGHHDHRQDDDEVDDEYDQCKADNAGLKDANVGLMETNAGLMEINARLMETIAGLTNQNVIADACIKALGVMLTTCSEMLREAQAERDDLRRLDALGRTGGFIGMMLSDDD